jgi:Ca2+-binding EF-hand superfamily protein
MKPCAWWVLGLALLAPGSAMSADPRTEYYQRAAERDVNSFRALDLDKDGAVTRVETEGDVDFAPRFNDMDINRDGVVTMQELQRYIEFHYGVAPPAKT